MKHERNARIDVMRAIGIVGVVLLHSTFQSRFDPGTLELSTDLARFFDWAVLIFFFTSGYLQSPGLSIREWLPKRALSLLAPFVIYNLAYNIAFFAMSKAGFHEQANTVSRVIPWSFWLFHSPAFQLYFLPYLFGISLFFFLASKCKPGSSRWFSGGVTLAVIGYYAISGFPDFSHGPELQKIPLYLASFATGSLMRSPPLSGYRLLAFSLVALIASLYCLMKYHFTPISLAIPPLLFCALSSSTWSGSHPMIQSLGQQSGSIYLWHTPLLLPMFTLWEAHAHIPSLANYITSVILCIGSCLLIRHAIDGAWIRAFQKMPPKWLVP